MKPELQFETSCTEKLSTFIGLVCDMFLMPLFFQMAWNFTMPEVFDVNNIKYEHALLFKLIISIFFASPFSTSTMLNRQSELLSYYINNIYAKLSNLDMNLLSMKQMYSQTLQSPVLPHNV
jgi:hypothetical protein